MTLDEPMAIMPGPPGTQDGSRQGWVVSVTRAAGWPPMVTVGAPTMMGSGNGGWGAGGRHQGRGVDRRMAMGRALQHLITLPRSGLAHRSLSLTC